MDESDKQIYKKALLCVADAARKIRRADFLNSVLAAGTIAYKDYKESKDAPAEIARRAVEKLPEGPKGRLTTEDKDIIRNAVAKTLSDL